MRLAVQDKYLIECSRV